MHKVDNVGIFVLLKIQNKFDIVFRHFNSRSNLHDNCKFCKFVSEFIQLVNILS